MINNTNRNKLICLDVSQHFEKINKTRITSLFINDKELGDTGEDEILITLKNKFGDTITKTKGKYNPFDFEGDNKLIELKTRRNRSNQYPTTMIGHRKILQCNDPNKEYYFIFKYTDKILYCLYCVEDFKGFEVKQSGRTDRGLVESDNYIYIPISYLKELI